MKSLELEFQNLIKDLTDIGIALSKEKDHNRLLELILKKAQDITHADGGTIYTCTEENTLRFEIIINRSMGLHMGGTSQNKINFANLPLYDKQGNPIKNMLAPWVAVSGKTVHIPDAYQTKAFDLSGTKVFDQQTGYHSQSFLTVPLTNHLSEVIGVLQLLNPIDKKTKKITSFSKLHQSLVESLASQAAVTLTNRSLIDAQKKLFDSLIQLVAQAIDEKSPYTGGHCRRVPIITQLIANAACEIKKGPLKEFTMSEDELYELEVAAWLHDCGKIITPEYVVDKSTKLERIIDGIHLIDTRFEVLKREALIDALQQQLTHLRYEKLSPHFEEKLQHELQQLGKERELIRTSNIGGEFLAPEQIQTIRQIAERKWTNPEGIKESFLTDEEVSMLEISRGTLSNEERQIINNHVSVTLKMLESLPYPKSLKNVPHLAASHHEKMDGTGYPRGLKKEQMPIQARIIAIADIFEALTANDRPYKKAMPISQALFIMGRMKLDGHIDPDLFDVFINEKIYQKYAKEHLHREEEIDCNQIPGYVKL